MTRAILTRTRTWTLATGLVTAVATGFLLGWDFGAGVLATAIWAVAGFWSLEGLFRSALVAPGTPRNVFAIIIWFITHEPKEDTPEKKGFGDKIADLLKE